MNRRQNIMEFTACDPQSGACRMVVREEWLPSWTTRQEIRFLEDRRRFIWSSERTGFRNYRATLWIPQQGDGGDEGEEPCKPHPKFEDRCK